MKPLDVDHSRKLFFNRFVCSESDCPQEFKEISYKIVEKCGGFPLATINMASLIASQPVVSMEQWTYICDSLSTGSSTNSTSEGTRSVINLSYNNLTHYLKTCLLYLNMYPEGCTICKDDLVKQWVAEGFIGAAKGRDMEKVAESYFDELVGRRFLQPARIKYNNEVVSCTVHDMVRDLIAYKSAEENFIMVVDYYRKNVELSDKVHRLSIHFGEAKYAKTPGNIRTSQVRSLTFFGLFKCMPSISEFKLLCILNLKLSGHNGEETLDLSGISELFQLRYFKVASDVCIELPKNMKGLQNLETLDIDTKVTDVPSDITHLPCLLHLRLPFDPNLMDRIGSMRPANVQSLGKLTNLQDLRLTCSTPPPDHLERNVEALGSLLGGLGNLKTLALVCDSSHRNAVVHCPSEAIVSWDGITFTAALLLLQRFEWSPCRGSFSRVPKWIGELHNLCFLKIAVRELLMDGVDVLRGLPALTALSLYVQTAPVERIVFGKAGFSVLKYFKFRCSLPWLKFEEDAMPKLRKLKLVFNAHSADQNDSTPISIEHLSCLKEISAKIGAAGADPESVLTAAVINHPSNPIINVQSVDWILCGDEDIKKVGIKPAIMTEDAMVSAFTGAMNSLLVKLATLLGEQHAKLTEGTRKEFKILKDALDAMKTRLEQLAGMAGLSAQMRDSRNQMREMTYDIEDCIDDLSRDVTTLSNDLILMLQNFTDQICKLKAQLRSMVPRTKMRSLGPSYMSREQWLSFDEGNGLVGMDGPRNELVSWLSGSWLSGDEQGKLQGVCILGVAGIGKTMLATQVYNEIKRRFHRCVFISASKKVDRATLCRSILLQLQETIDSNRRNDVRYLIYRVRTNLQDKRFLIVIDGVWSAQIVEDIKAALPENNRGSRIITTSGISDVAESCGKHFSSFIYQMKPLTFEESLGLFRSIIFGSGRSCPVASEKVDEEIVKACGGIPLALRLIAGALASKPAEMEQWVTSREIMKQAGTDHLNVEWMRKIFDISYSDLSCDMKTCLLYLSAFPENHVIRKDRLITRWVAEGFLLKRCGKTWWETGESYFLELVARNLVNPVYDEEDVLPIARNLVKPVYDEEDVLPIGCKVSGSVHDFITSLSSEENFVKSDVTDPTCTQHGVFRRLSVDLGSDNQEKPLDLFQGALSSKVRSLTFVDDFGFGWMSDLSAFKHVRVLDLKDNKRLENEQLESIGRLSLLSYLGLGGTSVTELPQQIMALEQLTTLDIRRTIVRKLPAFRDTKLVFLLADELIIPTGMGGMQELEELSKVLMGPDVAGLVNQLRRLRMLGVRFSRWYAQAQNQQEVKHFVEEVGKSNLQSLFLDNYPHHLLHLLADSWAHKRPHHLREIELRIRVSVVPEEMASLIALTHLHINVEEVGAQGVRALGNLPNLVLLVLVCSDTGVPRLAVSSKDGFQCLKVFCYWSRGMGLQFEAGAMPQLRRLVLYFNVRETISKYADFDFGVQHLSYLVQVRATVDCLSATASEVEAAEAKMRDQVSQNPNHPVLEWKTRQCSTAAAPAPAEGSVIAIHGLDEWFIQIEEANVTNKLVVIHFHDSSCGPSLKMAPVFADLAKKFPNVVFLKVDNDVDETRLIEESYNVDGWPTFLFMKGGNVKGRHRGTNKEELEWKLELQMAQ